MDDSGKAGEFGGLPEDLFNGVVVYLQGLVAAGLAVGASAADTAAAGAAVSALASLATSEHAAAASTFQVRPIDAVFKAIAIRDELAGLKKLGTAVTPGQLGGFKGDLDALATFWYTGK